MQFWNYFALRLFQAFMVVWVVTTIVFVVSRLVGNPETFLSSGLEATPLEIERIRERFGLNDSLGKQYLDFLTDTVQGDFGHSWGQAGDTTMKSIADRAPNTFKLGAAALVFAIAVSVPLGILAAIRRGTPLDWLARLLAVFGQAVPGFWLALMMVFFFAVQLGWFPTSGADGIRALILPAAALGMLEMAAIMRLTRSGMIEVMDQDFIRTARSKGLNERVVIFRHAIRHALLPVVSLLGITLGRLIAGSVIVELIFAWPGVGRLIIDSIRVSDYPMVQASIIVLSASIAVANLLVDVSYQFIDPRIRVGRS